MLFFRSFLWIIRRLTVMDFSGVLVETRTIFMLISWISYLRTNRRKACH
ncbi:hypothetical protein [Halobacillus naozhouensis]|uniref:Uncharacterized protein n=1 Tax=Halobacillus naozhouensis TaxID=554880 RepID=A0ABY8IYS0_9BACI|nr:hypothetical protein [Halobacillus naozhouensis]WFT74334.1 hypothetical protein P9989_18540 [Halobacillus naozhouensis]